MICGSSILSGGTARHSTPRNTRRCIGQKRRISERDVPRAHRAVQRLNLRSVELNRASMILRTAMMVEVTSKHSRLAHVNNIPDCSATVHTIVQICGRHGSVISSRRRINSCSAATPARMMVPVSMAVIAAVTVSIAITDAKAASAWHPSPTECADVRPAAALERQPTPGITGDPGNSQPSDVRP
jgi:hypothetical protein